jgi:hypothetical protein
MRRRFALACLLAAATPAAVPVRAADLSAKLVAGKSEYVLAADRRGAAVRAALLAGAQRGEPPFAPPEVDVALEIANEGAGARALQIGGDESTVTLTLDGDGAVNADLAIAMTMEYRMGQAVRLAPGARHSIPIRSLRSGTRGVARGSWWTEPGVYRLRASFRSVGGENDRPVEIETAPVEIKVTAAP